MEKDAKKNNTEENIEKTIQIKDKEYYEILNKYKNTDKKSTTLLVVNGLIILLLISLNIFFVVQKMVTILTLISIILLMLSLREYDIKTLEDVFEVNKKCNFNKKLLETYENAIDNNKGIVEKKGFYYTLASGITIIAIVLIILIVIFK